MNGAWQEIHSGRGLFQWTAHAGLLAADYHIGNWTHTYMIRHVTTIITKDSCQRSRDSSDDSMTGRLSQYSSYGTRCTTRNPRNVHTDINSATRSPPQGLISGIKRSRPVTLLVFFFWKGLKGIMNLKKNTIIYWHCWTVRGSNPGGGEIFRTYPDRPWGLPSLLYNGYQVFPGGKPAGAWCWPFIYWHSLYSS